MIAKSDLRQRLLWLGTGTVLVAALVLAFATPWHSSAYDTGLQFEDARQDQESSPQPPDGAKGREATARGLLAARLGVPAAGLAFVGEEAVRWPDTSLGCPQPGQNYARVIVPGYRLTFSYDGSNYEAHILATSGVGASLAPVSCEGGVAHPVEPGRWTDSH